jgi:hypothetical protein
MRFGSILALMVAASVYTSERCLDVGSLVRAAK